MLFTLLLLVANNSKAQVTGDYRSAAASPATWATAASWERYNGTMWVAPAPSAPVVGDGTITIRSGHTINVGTNISSIDQVVVDGILNVNSGITMTFANGTGTDLTVNPTGLVGVTGTLNVNVTGVTASIDGTVAQEQGALGFNGTATTINFNSGSVYNHKITTSSGTIPTATWNAASTINIVGYTTGTSISGAGQTVGNFTWNCASQSGSFSFGGTFPTVAGTFTVTSTGTGQLRMVSSSSATMTVNNFTQTGGAFVMSSGAGIGTLNIQSSMNRTGGTIDENSSGAGTIAFTGSSAQTPTIGSNITNKINYQINNAAGVTAALTLNSTAGLIMTTGLISALPTYSGSNTLTYNGAADQTVGVEWPATSALLITINKTVGTKVALNTGSTVQLSDNTNPLTLTNGVISLSSNTVLRLGDGSTHVSTVPAGSSSTFIDISASGSAYEIYTSVAGGRNFPVGFGPVSNATQSSSNFNRINFGSLTATGYIRVELTNGEDGTTGTGINGFVNTKRWKVSSSNTFTSFSSVAMQMGTAAVDNPNNYVTADFVNYRVVNASTLSGAYSVIPFATYSGNNATNVNISGLFTNYTSIGFFAVGIDVPNNFTAAVDNNWGTVGNWSLGHLPTSMEAVTITSPKTVDLSPAATYDCASLTITGTFNDVASSILNCVGNVTLNTSGVLNMPTGILNIGNKCGDNKVLQSNTGCTLNLTGTGAINVGGSVDINGGSTYNMTGTSTLTVDPNSGVSGTSAANFLGTVDIGATTYGVTGGTITINDPNFNSSGYAFYFTGSPASLTNWAGNKIVFGGNYSGGCVNDASSCTDGFAFRGNPKALLGDVEINGGSATNYHGSIVNVTSEGVFIGGTFTINSDSEFRTPSNSSTLSLAGNVVNNGTFTVSGQSSTTSLRLETTNFTTGVASTNAQTFSGSGIYRDGVMGTTGQIGALSINNSNATGITFPSDLTVLGILTHTAGIITMGTGSNILTVGVGTGSVGTYTYTAGRIIGKFRRWKAATTGTLTFPIGTTTSGKTVAINHTTAPTTGGTLTAQWVAGNPGFSNAAPLVQGAITVDKTHPEGAWQIDAANSFAGGTYTATFSPSNVPNPSVNDFTKLVLLKRSGTNGDWSLDGTHVTTTGSNAAPVLSRTVIANGFSQFAIGSPSVVLAVDFTALSATNKGATNLVTFTTADEKDLTVFQIERSTTGTEGWSNIGNVKAKGASTYTFVDANPLAIGYYRVRGVELSGKSIVSKIVSVNTGKAKLNVLNIYPSPTKNNVTIDFDAVASSNVTVSIKDITGRLILTKNVKGTEGVNNLTLDVANLPNGVYMMNINDNVSSIVKRIVKQ